MARTLTARLHQVEGRNSARLFELFDDRFLRVRRLAAHGRRVEYAMDVAILAPQQLRSDHRPWRWLIAAGVCLVLMLATALFAVFGGHALALSSLAVALLAGAVALTMVFFRQSHQLLTLHSRLSAVPLVEILADRPQAAEVNDFVEHLLRCINATVADKELSPEDLRAGELRSLRKLAENHAIDLAVYEQAKQHLLSLAL